MARNELRIIHQAPIAHHVDQVQDNAVCALFFERHSNSPVQKIARISRVIWQSVHTLLRREQVSAVLLCVL